MNGWAELGAGAESSLAAPVFWGRNAVRLLRIGFRVGVSGSVATRHAKL